MGKALAFACMIAGMEVTWFPSYGAEMRGGTANCTVVISDAMIGSPVVSAPDVLVVMNKPSLERFQPLLRRKGVLLYDSSLVPRPVLRRDILCMPVPAAEIASAAGTTRSGNMVMLGALVARTEVLPVSAVLKVFDGTAGPLGSRGSNSNLTLIMKGMRDVEDSLLSG